MEHMGKIEEAIAPYKVQQLVEIIMREKRLSFDDALHYLYSTDLYRRLLSEETKWWYASGQSLYELLEAEKQQERIAPDNRPVTLFLCFCVERYRLHTRQPAADVLALFEKHRVFDFLQTGFGALHTQGERYIMEEIDLFLTARNA